MGIPTANFVRILVCGASVAGAVAVGCSNKPEPFPRRHRLVAVANAEDDTAFSTTQPSDLLRFKKFTLYASPPPGWRMKVNDSDERAEHVVWTSPSGNTAFGVIFFKLPWPIGHDLTIRYGVLPEARRREGTAEILEKRWDPEIEGMRYTIVTPRYTAATKMFVRGMRGWAAYSGFQTTRPVVQEELDLAIRAREDAEFGEEVPATRPVSNKN